LTRSDQVLKRRWVVTILEKMATFALRLDQPGASFELYDEAVRTARRTREPLVIGEALVMRARSRQRLGDGAGALRDLAEAQRRLQEKPGSVERIVRAQLAAVRGEVHRRDDPAAAIESLTEALELYQERGARILRTEIYLDRGRARLALGFPDLAEGD